VVDGALCYRAWGPSRPLAAELSRRFTVFTYDRRGRGESGDTAPYALDHEIEDIQALVHEAGGSAHVYGISSGAVLALEAAGRGIGIESLVLYEPPFIIDDSRPPFPADYASQLETFLAANRRGDAVRLFMRQVGVPRALVALMRLIPVWRKVTATAHTLPYDAAAMGDTQAGKPLPAERWAGVTAPTLVVVGGNSPTWMYNGTRALADLLRNARHRVLEGQKHAVKPKVLAPVLVDFFGQPRAPRAIVPPRTAPTSGPRRLGALGRAAVVAVRPVERVVGDLFPAGCVGR
jgi:pimeloyl-ACP methyl ester carboxylesterase